MKTTKFSIMETPIVYSLGRYMPKNRFQQDDYSKYILHLKQNRTSARLYFYSCLSRYLRKLKENTEEIILCCPPRSTPNAEPQLRRVIEMLCSKFPLLSNGVDLLRKISPTPSLCRGGMRDYELLTQSISFQYIMPISNKRIILIDDVVTTGITFSVCKSILMHYGAKAVYCIALAETPKFFK